MRGRLCCREVRKDCSEIIFWGENWQMRSQLFGDLGEDHSWADRMWVRSPCIWNGLGMFSERRKAGWQEAEEAAMGGLGPDICRLWFKKRERERDILFQNQWKVSCWKLLIMGVAWSYLYLEKNEGCWMENKIGRRLVCLETVRKCLQRLRWERLGPRSRPGLLAMQVERSGQRQGRF